MVREGAASGMNSGFQNTFHSDSNLAIDQQVEILQQSSKLY